MLKLLNIALLTAIFAFPVFFPVPVFSQEKPADRATIEIIKAGIRETAQKTKTLASDFTQEKEMSMIREKIISKGKFYFKKERMLRWEYLQPFNYLIIIRDEQISIKDDNKVTRFNMMSNKVFQEINRIILGSIRGTLVSDEKNFKTTFYDGGTAWIVKLQTLSPGIKASLSEITIYFDRKDYSVNRLEMAEPGGDFTRITFSEKKVNQPVADEKFLVH